MRTDGPSKKAYALSEALFQGLVQKGSILREDAIESQRLAEITETLVRSRAPLRLRPRVHRSRDRGAFTLPDGRILVSSKTFAGPRSEDVVAFAVAHELAHRELGHLHALYAWDDSIRYGASVLEIERALSPLVHAHADERAADQHALESIVAAGYDAHGAVALLRSQRDAPLREPRMRRLAVQIEREEDARTSGASPTFRTRLCTGCLLRHTEPRCPECATESPDLATGSGRAAARRALEADHVTPTPDGEPWLTGGSMVDAALASGHLVEGLVAVAALIVGTLLAQFVLNGGRATRRALYESRPGRTRPVRLAPRVLPGWDTASVRGVATTDRSLIAPVSRRRCIAWRLEGRSPFGPIHDAAYTAFRVADRTAGEVEIPERDAWITFGRSKPRRRAPSRTIEWLETRVIVTSGTDLVETIIEVGDVVEVFGPRRRSLAGGTYRSASRERIEWEDDGALDITTS